MKAMLLTLPVAGGLLSSCSEWDDHYDGNGGSASGISIWDEIKSNPMLSDFAEVMDAISVTRQHKKTTTQYSQLLSGGRSLTIFAPVNGSFDKKSLIDEVQTNSGDSAVEKYFAQNHIVSSPRSFVGDGENQKMLLMNYKYATFADSTVNGVEFLQKNINCRNGVMHIIKKPIPYSYTIYEALTNFDAFKPTGDILKSYNIQEFDEQASTSAGTVDGVKVFVDSVTYDRNKMVEAIGNITANDSSYIAVVPETAGWNTAWEKTSAAFVYPNTIAKRERDSLQTYYTFRALMDDAIFSMTTVNKNQKDSLISKFYNRRTPEYHVFYKPYEEGGILSNPTEIIECCNGKLYKTKNWNFEPTMVYHKKIEVEAERYEDVKTNNLDPNAKLGRVGLGTSAEPYVSRGGYAEINESSNWSVTYKIPNTLSARYDVKMVLLPLLIVDKTSTARPNKFKVSLNYLDADGNQQVITSGDIINDMFYDQPVADTITVLENVALPVCNYDMDNSNVSLTITANVGARETGKYSRRMFLDAIILTPKED